MNNIRVPELSIRYYELKVYVISFGPQLEDNVRIIAPDSHAAVSAFCALWPSRDVVNFTCVGDCISLYPGL